MAPIYQWQVSSCCLPDQGRIEKETLSFDDSIIKTSRLVSLLIPIGADRVDLLFCNANSISDQIVTGYPLARWICCIYPDVADDAGWWGNCSTHLMVVGWIGLQSL